MKKLPTTSRSLLLRTDFADDQAWFRLCRATRKPNKEGFTAYFNYIDDIAYEGLTIEEIVDTAAKGEARTYICVADHITLTDAEQLILVVDCYDRLGQVFRVTPSEVWSVENNLSIANMDFQEFVSSCDNKGVFRGF